MGPSTDSNSPSTDSSSPSTDNSSQALAKQIMIVDIFQSEARFTVRQLSRSKVTVNPIYNDTRYNDIIRYNSNLTGTKLTLKR